MKVCIESPDKLRKFCSELEGYVREIWENIAKDVFNAVKLDYSCAVKMQIKSLLQVYYASEVYKSGENFSKSYIDVIKRLGSAKMLRSFTQLDEGYGRKCDLMHEYNALFCREIRNYIINNAQIVNADKINQYKLDKYIQSGEALSAPAFVKRCLKFAVPEFDDNFPPIEDIYEMYGDKLVDDDKHGYYAIVMFDGDDMGMWYSTPDDNSKGKGVSKAKVEDFQKYLSRKISEFAAEKSRKIVDWKSRKNGVVIYAGGEDFLGALNIKNVFSALKELRETFGQMDIESYSKESLTFSAGVVLAHVKAPLSEVLNMVRNAEKKAKANPGKDAYCLTIAKRSGEITEFVKPFYYDKECKKSSLDDLHKLVEIIVDKKISTKFIYQLGTELERITKTDNTELQKEVFLLEARRILKRSVLPDKNKKNDIVEEDCEYCIVEKICEILNQMAEISSIKNLLSYLRAVAFIARERGAT